tara:strand:+ start:722 stop:904 length:183 start_codon:yes stop_codon:yes gene_type:complete
MEVLLITLFFITALILFIAGKDDFGRATNKSIIQGREKVKKEGGIAASEVDKKESKLETN